jgi:hypothetical protein
MDSTTYTCTPWHARECASGASVICEEGQSLITVPPNSGPTGILLKDFGLRFGERELFVIGSVLTVSKRR